MVAITVSARNDSAWRVSQCPKRALRVANGHKTMSVFDTVWRDGGDSSLSESDSDRAPQIAGQRVFEFVFWSLGTLGVIG